MITKDKTHNNILQYQSNLQIATNDIINIMGDTLNSISHNTLFNYTQKYHISTINLTTDFDSSLLPNHFKNYITAQTEMFNENLCIHSPTI